MKKAVRIFGAAAIVAATAALAQGAVQNPAVRDRMEAMTTIGVNLKTIGDMAKGARPFDAAAAQSAATAISEQAALVPTLFEPQENDPESEARAEIWTNWDDFTAKADALETAATQVAGSLQTADDLSAALGNLGGACMACHKVYRD